VSFRRSKKAPVDLLLDLSAGDATHVLQALVHMPARDVVLILKKMGKDSVKMSSRELDGFYARAGKADACVRRVGLRRILDAPLAPHPREKVDWIADYAAWACSFEFDALPEDVKELLQRMLFLIMHARQAASADHLSSQGARRGRWKKRSEKLPRRRPKTRA